MRLADVLKYYHSKGLDLLDIIEIVEHKDLEVLSDEVSKKLIDEYAESLKSDSKFPFEKL